MRELAAPKYPRTRLYSQDYGTVLWDSYRDTGTAEDFLRASEYDWLGAVRDHAPNNRTSVRLVKDGDEIKVWQDTQFLQYLLHWPNPYVYESPFAHTELGDAE